MTMVNSIIITLPNGKKSVCHPTAASVCYHDPVQLAEIINFLVMGHYSNQELITVVTVKMPDIDLGSISHAGEAVLVFTKPQEKIEASLE
jgi:hypothetical protein